MITKNLKQQLMNANALIDSKENTDYCFFIDAKGDAQLQAQDTYFNYFYSQCRITDLNKNSLGSVDVEGEGFYWSELVDEVEALEDLNAWINGNRGSNSEKDGFFMAINFDLTVGQQEFTDFSFLYHAEGNQVAGEEVMTKFCFETKAMNADTGEQMYVTMNYLSPAFVDGI